MKTAIKSVVSYAIDPRISTAFDVFYKAGKIRTFYANDLPKSVQTFIDGAHTELIDNYCLLGYMGCRFTRPEWNGREA